MSCICRLLYDIVLRGFVKLIFFFKSDRNSEVGGWVKPQLGFLFFGEILCGFFFVVNVSKINTKLDRRVGGCDLENPSFSQIFLFFNLTRPLKHVVYNYHNFP